MGLPLPRQKPVFMVTGKAIPVARMSRDDPKFNEEVDRVHALVVQALQVSVTARSTAHVTAGCASN